jgi:hypothetical protein
MSAPRDLDRLLQSFLKEGPQELPDPSYDEVRDRMEHTRQRAFIGPWRTPDMNRYLKIGLAAAAVLVIAVVGFQYLGRSNSGGPGATETPQPTATPEPSSSAPAELPVGSSHVLYDHAAEGIKIVVTIPAAGWFGNAGGGVLKKNDSAGAPDGAEVTVFAMTNYGVVGTGDVAVYGDPCHWASPPGKTRVTTVDEAIAALSAQPSHDAAAPADVTYDGYAGKRITLHVPDDAVFADCDEGEFRTLYSWSANHGASAARVEDAGQFDVLTVLDVDGQLVIFDLAYFEGVEGTPASVLDEMAGIMESAIFQSYDP